MKDPEERGPDGRRVNKPVVKPSPVTHDGSVRMGGRYRVDGGKVTRVTTSQPAEQTEPEKPNDEG